MDFKEKELQDLGLGALLHDIGKVLVPNAIFMKEGPLDELEFELMKKHSEMGFETLKSNRELSILVSHVALQHHERYDGTGYPLGKKRNGQ